MKILITGINGSLGLNTAIQLYEKGYEIIGFGHLKNNSHPIINKIEFIEGDYVGHYNRTPYAYLPKLGRKYVAPFHVDLGQGLMQLIDEVRTGGIIAKENLEK